MTKHLSIIAGLILGATAAQSCERSEIEGDWLLATTGDNPYCHLKVTASSSRIVCVSAATGMDAMDGNVEIVDRNGCIVAGRFVRGDNQFSFMVSKKDAAQPEGNAIYGGTSFPVSLVRP
jgi:hypothetical protein